MDGHTAHINIAVSEFCMEHGIILYCFPAHASHILQPLDISVFGPLKKEWNRQIESFRAEFNVPMSRLHFFRVFDRAWKNASSEKNAKSGFRVTGLVPFNPDKVDYRKLIDAKSVDKWKKTRDRNEISGYEKLGLMRAFNVVEKILTIEQRTQFEKRFDEGYDCEDDSVNGQLWSIYKSLKNMFQGNQQNDEQPNAIIPQLQDSTETVQSAVVSLPDVNDVFSPPTSGKFVNVIRSAEAITSPTLITTNKAVVQTPSVKSMFPVQHSSPQPSTSAINAAEIAPIAKSAKRQLSYEHFEYSPFKKYLKIADNVIITRKVPKAIIKTPPAISGRDYHENLHKIQEKKKRDLELKESRKLDREAKKAEREAKKIGKKVVKSNSPESSDQDETDIIYARSSDDEIEDEKNVCSACLGDDGLESGNLWIGCNQCIRWYHRSCISEEVEQMNEREIAELNFICVACLVKEKRMITTKAKKSKKTP